MDNIKQVCKGVIFSPWSRCRGIVSAHPEYTVEKMIPFSKDSGQNKRHLQFCSWRARSSSIHAPPLPLPLPCSNPSLAATAADLLLVVGFLGWGMVGGWGRMVFAEVDGVDGVDRWRAARECGPVPACADHHLCGQEEQDSNSGSRWRQRKNHTHIW